MRVFVDSFFFVYLAIGTTLASSANSYLPNSYVHPHKAINALNFTILSPKDQIVNNVNSLKY